MIAIIKKGGIGIFYISLVFLISCFLYGTVYVNALLPPPPPDIDIILPTHCDPTNGGTEICDSIDNDCDGTVDEDVCTSDSSDSDSGSSSGSGSSGHKSSGGGGSSGYIAPVIVKNSTTPSVPGTSNVNKGNASMNTSNVSATSSNDLPPNNSTNSSMKGSSGKNLIFGLTPLKTLIYGSIIIIALVLLLLLFMEYFIKRPKSSKNALSGTYPASRVKSVPDTKNASNLSGLDFQDEAMIRYIAEMRQKGFNDDDIMIQLKNRGKGKQ